MFFPYNNELLKKEIIRSLWEQILSFKGIYLSKALTCMKLFPTKIVFYQGDGPLATLLNEQFIYLTQITLRHNIQLLSNRQHAYQSF